MSPYRPVVGDLLDINTERAPSKEAVIDPARDVALTWAELNDQVSRLANFLIDMGIKPGDRIAVFLRDSIEFVTSLFAVAKAGCVFAPLNYRLAPEELRYVLNDCKTKVLIFDRNGSEVLDRIRAKIKSVVGYIYTGKERPAEVNLFIDAISNGRSGSIKRTALEDDLAMIMYTSGTTGSPKGTIHTHRGILEATGAWTRPAGISQLDRSIALGPLYHIGPLLSNFMPTVFMGGSNVIQKQFDPAGTLKWIDEHGITVMWATPTHLNMLASVAEVLNFRTSSLRAIQYSGAPLSTGLFYKIRDVFGQVDLINAYGMTELDSVAAVYPAEHDDHLGTVGRALPKNYIRIVESNTGDPGRKVDTGKVGEIIVRSPAMMKEYWGLPEKTKEVIKSGWYFTGDLGRMDADGYLYYVEREDYMIISGGENIYPLEVENVLSKHKKVANVAVLGISHTKWGEVVAAVVVKADVTLTQEELEEYCLQSDELARYKRPKRYTFIEDLPTTSSGKVDKKLLLSKLNSEIGGPKG
jgi:fatty-acyl-CoA synthase